MRRSRFGSDVQQLGTPWLITFSDLLTLILATFVLRLSMSSLSSAELEKSLQMDNRRKAEIQAQSLRVGKSIVARLRADIGEPRPLQTANAALAFGDAATVEIRDRGIFVRLGEGGFMPAQRDLSESTRSLVTSLAGALRGQNVRIFVEGHTDNIPIATVEYPSNWELSAARAIEVAELLVAGGVEGGRISAVGYADTQPRGDNSTEEGRALNRRVEIMIEPSRLATSQIQK